MYKYAFDWKKYAYSDSGAKFATNQDIKSTFTKVNIAESKFSASGIPLLIEDGFVYVNSEMENTLIFGETGSKKTRCLVKPLIALTGGAGNSAVITDVKGELSSDPKLRSYLESKGIRCVSLDFRFCDKDSYNIFQYAINLYKNGHYDKAMANITSIVHALNEKYEHSTADPYWQLMEEQHLLPILHMLLEICEKNKEYEKYVNMLSVSSFANEKGTELLECMVENYYRHISNNSIQMLKSVLSTPEKTKSSIISVTASVLRDFIMQESLTAMLSDTTFSITDMYEKPTFVFLIIPDENSTYDTIAGLLLDNFYSQLLEIFTEKYQNRMAPPCNISFICDEMCNVKINDMRAKISASRSRYIRWYLICQSLRQLEAAYENEASTIVGNCKNIILLQSSDPSMLEYISNLCGNTNISLKEGGEPLLPPEKLKHLKKTREYKEAIYIRESLVYLSILPDYDQYAFLQPYTEFNKQKTKKKKKKVAIYTPEQMLRDIESGKIDLPFKDKSVKV